MQVNSSLKSDFRSHLQSSVAESAAPYGYTLTIFSVGSVASYLIGKPHVFEVLLLVGGAVLAFVSVELAAYQRFRIRLKRGESPKVEVWAYAHLVSAGLAIAVSWGILQAVDSTLGWLLVGFLATVIYVTVDAAQVTLAARSAATPATSSTSIRAD